MSTIDVVVIVGIILFLYVMSKVLPILEERAYLAKCKVKALEDLQDRYIKGEILLEDYGDEIDRIDGGYQ